MKHNEFDRELRKGRVSYDKKVGDWWLKQSRNKAHIKAYNDIADQVKTQWKKNHKKDPEWIVDYACGSGTVLIPLAERFPKSNIIALDGSTKMLEQAEKALAKKGIECQWPKAKKAFEKPGPRIRLLETNLPNFSLPKKKADLAVFIFPNLTYTAADQEYYDKHGYLNKKDTKVAEMLARFREMDPEDEVGEENADDNYDAIMTDRVISRNLRQLLKEGGMVFRAEYANAAREELTELTNWRSLFSEGALDRTIKDKVAPPFFEYLGNKFFKSSVILDVFHQTGDPTDKVGGFFVSHYKAIKA